MKKVLITGGSSGIGAATVELFKQSGYDVTYPDIDELNLLSLESIESFFYRKRNEKYDILINDAGINEINNVENITEDELSRTMLINLISPIRLIKHVVPSMKEQKFGRIVNLGSIWGVVGKPGRTAYSASKHGIHGVTSNLAVELAPYNILINTVCPGFTLTDLTYKNNTKEQIESISRDIPMGRMAQPIEQARLIEFLISEKNTYITGQQIVVDGGYSSK